MPSSLADGLCVPHLRRLWQRAMTAEAPDAASLASEWAADQAVIYGLGLGLQQTLTFLYSTRPSLAAFEQWVIDHAADLTRLSDINAAVSLARGEPASAEPTAGTVPLHQRLADAERVFDESDLRFWDENGYVVLRNAVSPEACRDAAEAIWAFLGMNPDDPDTWYGSGALEGVFIRLVQHPAFDRNRYAPRIRKAFAQLWGTDDLLVTVDRGGFSPPQRPGWQFVPQGLHWDTSLVTPLPLDMGGILYLTDTPAEQGAFQCVPGFHRRIETWLAGLPEGSDPRAQDLSAEAVRVPGKAGDLVIWHKALPHSASPNQGAQPRLAQYISYFCPGIVDDRPWR